MSNRKPANQGHTHLLPERANLEHLRNEAKQRLKAMRIDNPGATLASAQLATARLYGFTSWRRLVAYVKAQRDEENQPLQPGENPPQSFSDGLKEKATSSEAKAQLVYDEAAKGVAHNKFVKFQRRTRQLAIMTDTIAMIKMMRGLAQINGQGQQAAELILNADLDPNQRAKLISDLIKFWVRQNADAAMAWGGALTAPEDVRAAIPHLIYHRDSDQIRQMVETYLESHDPVIELALIEAAMPRDLMINPQMSGCRSLLYIHTLSSPNCEKY